MNFAFTNLEAAFGDVQVELNTRGDLGGFSEFYTITTEGSVSLGNAGNRSRTLDCNVAYKVDTFTITQADFNGYIAGDGTLAIEADPTFNVGDCAFFGGQSTFNDVFVKLSYIRCGPESTTAVVAAGVGEEV